jgi:hypothetical protein
MSGVRGVALAFAILCPAAAVDPIAIAEKYVDELLPAFKNLDEAKLKELYSPHCIFGNPVPGEQKDVLMTGLKTVYNNKEMTDKAFRDKIEAMKIMSAVHETSEGGRITAWVKVEVKGEEAFYQWVVLVPFKDSWISSTVLMSSAPVSSTAELVEQPVQTVGDAEVSVAAWPASVALVAAFASGLLLPACFFGRKELSGRLMALRGRQEPLL